MKGKINGQINTILLVLLLGVLGWLGRVTIADVNDLEKRVQANETALAVISAQLESIDEQLRAINRKLE